MLKSIFKPTAWAVDNRVSVFMLTALITLGGIITYQALPKAQFPDIVIPTIYVNTIYQGTSPEDVENLLTRPIEKELKSISGVKKIESESVQDVSIIIIEFTTDVEPSIAKQRVQDAVDKAKTELPADLDKDPAVQEVDFSEFPIMSINVAGDFDLDKLKSYAEDLQDAIETLTEITRVDIIGAPENEVQINVDLYKMQAAGITFNDIAKAVSNENVNLSGGEIKLRELSRTLRVVGEFQDVREIEDIIVSAEGKKVYLRDIATVENTYADAVSFARLDRQPVITLSVIKKSGENLIAASEKIDDIIAELRESTFPDNLILSKTNDQSVNTRNNLAELLNSVLIGFLLVVLILMFFMGVRNAIFVGLAVPLSSALSFLFLPTLEFSFNIVVTFSFLLALGIIVDNAIVVIENTYRLYTRERMEITSAAKYAAGEVFGPVLAGTLTTLGPFVPLLFWPGLIGEFMIYIPVVLIITLTASLFVAFIINPVFAVKFMVEKDEPDDWKGILWFGIFGLLFGLIAHGADSPVLGNLFFVLIGLVLLNKYFLTPILIKNFQNHVVPWMIDIYTATLRFVLKGWRPVGVLLVVFGFLVFTMMLMSVFPPPVVLFPESEPNQIFTYIEMPSGTRVEVTDSVTHSVEERILRIVGEDNPIVKSVIANVGIGAGEPNNPDRANTPHKGRITVDFVEYKLRNGYSTQKILDSIRSEITSLPGAQITVDKEQNGPPTGKPIQLEITGENFDTLISLEGRIKRYLVDSLNIQGIEELKSDLVVSKPEIVIDIDRERANREGISSQQVGQLMRTALYGWEITQFRSGEDEYPVQLRLQEQYRQDLNAMMNLKVSWKDGPTFREVPITSIADISFGNTFGGINRRDLKRVVTLSSNVLTGYTPNEINAEIAAAMERFKMPSGYELSFGGEQEEQEETGIFLATAFGIAGLLVIFILVTQFNSMLKTMIIMSTVVFSTIGVFIGFIATNLTFSIVMSGVGIVSLAGIVVNNGILLIDFTDIRRKAGLGIKRSIIDAGKTRFTPVILTAVTTMLGLVPLAIGLNIDFATLLTDFDPNFYLGGDNTAFWEPMASAIIFGLFISTILTLVFVPAMYQMVTVIGIRWWRFRHRARLAARARRAANNSTLDDA